MFTTFRTETFSGKPRFLIMDFGFRTDSHPKFSSQARADAYIEKIKLDPAKVSAALAVKAKADRFRAGL